MPNEPIANPDPTQDPKPNEQLFAGKLTPEGLEKATIELRTKHGLPALPEGKTLVGDNGIWPTHVALEAEYMALETIQGKLSQPKPPPAPNADPNLQISKPDAGLPAGGIAAVLKAAGLEGQEKVLSDHFIEHNKLTDDQYKKLATSSIPRSKEEVDDIIRGKIAEAQLVRTQMTTAKEGARTLAGGETQLNTLMEFAKTLPAEHVSDLNSRLQEPGKVGGVVRELLSLHSEAVGAGSAEELHTGGLPNTDGSAKITSHKDLEETIDKAAQGDVASIAKMEKISLQEMHALTQ